MLENKLSDEEVVTSLKCCIDSNCDECPYTKKNIDCSLGRHEKDCIELINRLGGTTTRCSWKNKFLNLVKENGEQKRYIEYLQRKLDRANVTYRRSL